MLRYKINILENRGFRLSLAEGKILPETALQKMRSGNTSVNLPGLEPDLPNFPLPVWDLAEWAEDEQP